MITLLLKKKTESERPKLLPTKARAKRERMKTLLLKNLTVLKLPKSSSEEENSDRSMDRHLKRMTELENRLEAIAHRCDIQEVGGSLTIPDRVGHRSLPFQIQDINIAHLRWQGITITKPTHISLLICSIKQCYHGLSVYWHPEGGSL